ncbi:hypothetical protein [Streptoalloteichus hindustanus]|uniref:Uncharacterized protein n=1 Tax=Streptoalloteichus hindustanus TaxID=2017 RepID=A0A1M5BEH1_STRHI|nr:hypothetical protein [Streptoalloteichus hindustanus]SHF40562.1 hypothetical protein SAMN05444320_103520 [Streptoalloteichus hindustanus]
MNANRNPGGEHGDAGGRLAEELRSLVDAVAERAEPWLERMRAGAEAGHDAGACGWCPVCQGLALLRGERPELAGRITEQVTGLVATLRAVVEQGGGTGQRREEPPTPADPTSADPVAADPTPADRAPAADQAAAEPRVRRITVRRAAPTGDGGAEC